MIISELLVQGLVQALDVRGVGGVRLTQFVAAASDRRCNNACSLLATDAFGCDIATERIGLKALAAILEHQNLAVEPTALVGVLQSASIPITEACVKLKDLEVIVGTRKMMMRKHEKGAGESHMDSSILLHMRLIQKVCKLGECLSCPKKPSNDSGWDICTWQRQSFATKSSSIWN